jgi:hypothetical protein
MSKNIYQSRHRFFCLYHLSLSRKADDVRATCHEGQYVGGFFSSALHFHFGTKILYDVNRLNDFVIHLSLKTSPTLLVVFLLNKLLSFKAIYIPVQEITLWIIQKRNCFLFMNSKDLYTRIP